MSSKKLPLALLSLGTSGVFLLISTFFIPGLFSVPVVRLLFFALLPTLAAVDVVTEGRGWNLFAQVWATLSALGAVGSQVKQQKLTPAEALATARAELFKAFSERWPQGHTSLRRPLGLSSQRPEVLSSSTSGSSLYEQVKGSLKDHLFPRSSGDAPVYLMDPASGCFLKATADRKLVFTSKPNASCLFYIERGKTHHWGFKSVASRRYMGQNFVQKMIAASKKLHAWESFRVLQRPEDMGYSGCSPQVYLILCRARFGKGMWLANKPGASSFASPGVPTSRINSNSNFEIDEDSFTEHHGSPGKRGVYLAKQFDHAIGLVYSSDLSSLMSAASEMGSQSGVSSSRSLARAQTAPHLTKILQGKGTAFQAPILTNWELGDMRLPWLEAVAMANVNSGRPSSFLEMLEKDMTEVMTATIPGCSVDDFLEMIVPRATRIKSKITREVFTRSAPVGASAGISKSSVSIEKITESDMLREWYSHPQFGLLRALGYRPDARAIPRIPIASNNKNDPSSTMPASMKAVTIEQYHSCTVDDESPDVNLQSGDEKIAHKATLRSKIYTLSIPYSNCFSIEVVVDIEDVQSSDDNMQEDVTTTTSQREISITASSSGKSADSEHTEGIERKSALRIRWRAGVVFSRSTMLRAEIEQGALEGIKSTCTAMLKVLRDKHSKQPSAAQHVRRGSLLASDDGDTVSALPKSRGLDSSSRGRTREKLRLSTDLSFIPRTFALEIVKGLITAICDAKPLSENFSTLPLHLPWTAFNPANSSARGHPSAHVITATTATPFFESSPEEFAQVLEESLGCKVTAPLFYEALLSDGCSFFRPSHADSGTMEVDISAWRAFVSSLQPHERASGFIRKQVFRMPLSGIPGVDVAEVEDFQYYALVQGCSGGSPMSAPSHDNENGQDKRGNFNGSQTLTLRRDKKRPSSTLCLNKETQPLSRDKKRPPSGLGQQKECKPRDTKARRLEFGMKLFIPALPEGSQFTIEVLVIVEPAEDDPSSNILRVLFASPPRHRRPGTRAHAVVNPHVVAGVLRGLKKIWKHVAHTMVEICEANSDYVVLPHQLQHQEQAPHGLDDVEMYLVHQSRAHAGLPTHDELASKVIEAIAAMY